jgi:hypothetical protein
MALLDAEDGSSSFLLNVMRFLPDYTALHLIVTAVRNPICKINWYIAMKAITGQQWLRIQQKYL